MRATFYARVSTDKEEQKNSIKSQVEYFTEYIVANKLIAVPHCGVFCKSNGEKEPTEGCYVDEGLTASKSNFKNRQAFKQMIADAKSKKFDMIFVKSISRFSRSLETTVRVIKDLKEIGIGVYFDDIKVNSLQGQNEMLISMFAAMAQEESRNKSVSIQFGIMRSMKDGKWTAMPPYGYNKVKGFLEINAIESEIVKKIYNWYLKDGMGVIKIRNQLKEDEIISKKGNAVWNSRTVSAILSNPIYMGRMIQHKSKKIDINRGIIEIIPKTDHITHILEHLRLINDDDFNLVQIEKERRMEELGKFEHIGKKRLIEIEDGITTEKPIKTMVRNSSRHSNTHLFSNIFFCAYCLGSMRRKKTYWRKKLINKTDIEWQWMCRNNDINGKATCPNRNLIMELDLIEELKLKIVDFNKNNYLHDKYLESLIKTNYNIVENETVLKSIREEFDDQKNMRESNFKLYSKGKIDDQEYEDRNDSIKNEISRLATLIGKHEYMDKELDVLKLQYGEFLNTVKSIDLENLTNPILKKLIKKIYKYKNEDKPDESFLEIEWNIAGESDSLLFERLYN